MFVNSTCPLFVCVQLPAANIYHNNRVILYYEGIHIRDVPEKIINNFIICQYVSFVVKKIFWLSVSTCTTCSVR